MFPPQLCFLRVHAKAGKQKEEPSASRSPTLWIQSLCMWAHAHTLKTLKHVAVHKINTISKNHESITCNYFLLQLLCWMWVSPRWCFGGFRDEPCNWAKEFDCVREREEAAQRVVYLITLLCFEVCGILSSWNISASSRAHTKKQKGTCAPS